MDEVNFFNFNEWLAYELQSGDDDIMPDTIDKLTTHWHEEINSFCQNVAEIAFGDNAEYKGYCLDEILATLRVFRQGFTNRR